NGSTTAKADTYASLPRPRRVHVTAPGTTRPARLAGSVAARPGGGPGADRPGAGAAGARPSPPPRADGVLLVRRSHRPGNGHPRDYGRAAGDPAERTADAPSARFLVPARAAP